MVRSRSAPVIVERDGSIVLMTMNRPESLNAVNSELHAALGNALSEADSDMTVRAIVLTGAGERAFCVGADLRAIARGESVVPADPMLRSWGFAGITSQPLSVPLIAAVNGVALGGGAEIVLACDLAIAADNAELGFPEVRRGIVAAAGGAFRLPRTIPRKLALELLYTGSAIDARRAAELGLVNAVVPADQVRRSAMDLARRIAENAPLAVRATKRIAAATEAGGAPADEADLRRSRAELEAILSSEDVREGASAFVERRAPRWMSR